MDEIDIIVRQVGKESIKEQISLFNNVFHMNVQEKNWTHKHHENPLKKLDNVFGAFDRDRLIGLNAFMPMEYVYEDRIIGAVQSCESAVDPAYRGQGIFTKIIYAAEQHYAENGYDVMTGFPNGNSFPGFIKMGWTHAANYELMRIPCHFARIVHDRLHIPALKIFDLPSGFLFSRINRNTNKCAGGILTEVAAENYFALPSLKKTVFAMVQSEEMLKWKLKNENCLFFTICCGQRTVAKFIVKINDGSSLIRAQILSAADLMSDPDTFIGAYSLLLLHLRTVSDIVSVMVPCVEEDSILYNKIGFRSHLLSPFIIRPISKNLSLRKLLSNKKSWCLEFLDTDFIITLGH